MLLRMVTPSGSKGAPRGSAVITGLKISAQFSKTLHGTIATITTVYGLTIDWIDRNFCTMPTRGD